MYNLLIVDDEIVLLKGLVLDIDWSAIGIGTVFRAQSAGVALSLMKENRIDIIITDICMPGTSGLELAEQVHLNWPHCKVILLSGYSNFEYAQKAISYGVFDYVTKPIEYEKLQELVGRAISQIESEITALSNWERVESLYNAALPALQEKYLAEWITGKTTYCSEILIQNNNLLANTTSFLILLNIYGVDSYHLEEKFRIAVRNLFESLLLKTCNWMRCENHAGVFIYVVYSESRTQLVEAQKYLEQMGSLLQEYSETQFHGLTTILWQEKISEWETLPQEYEKMMTWASQKLIWQSGLFMPVRLESSVLHLVNCGDEPFQLYELLELHKEEEALKKITKYLSGIDPTTDNSIQLITYFQVCHCVASLCSKKGIDLQTCFKEDAAAFYNFSSFGSSRELEQWCQRVIHTFIKTDQLIQTKSNSNLIESAKKLIKEQLTEDISVASLAEQLYIHPNYLSRIFRTETGISLVAYIILLKMLKAQKLLSVPGSRVNDVAFLLGYESVAHFGMIFKREVGLTPKEYQKQFTNYEAGEKKRNNPIS